jgi:hypothetical protein
MSCSILDRPNVLSYNSKIAPIKPRNPSRANRQAKPSLKDRLATITAAGQNRPPSALPRALAIGVNFVKELPARRAEVLSINGSVGAHGGPAFFKNHEALSAAYRHRR